MTDHGTSWAEHVRAAMSDAVGEDVQAEAGFGPLTVDVPVARWVEAVALARDGLHCTFFDWLSAVDELTDGFRVVCHLVDHRPGGVAHLLLRTRVPRESPRVPSVAHLFAGAAWHERETSEMFGIDFTVNGEPLALEKLLLPDEFEGHPLRKDFVLASRVAKPWPGAKEPGESDHGGAPSRRRTRPPGVPDPEQWGPREPGSAPPDPLAAAAAGPATRPRRARRASGAPGARGASVAEDVTDIAQATDVAQTPPPGPGSPDAGGGTDGGPDGG